MRIRRLAALVLGAASVVSPGWWLVRSDLPAVVVPYVQPDTYDPWFPYRDAPTDALLGSGVIASLDAPATVAVGESIDYRVMLVNPTAVGVRLDPCPGYREAAGESATVEFGYELLNCRDAPATIPAGGAVVFEMSIPLAEGLGPGGDISLIWTAGDNLGISDGAVITVVP